MEPVAPRWPALAAAWYINVFGAVAGGAVLWNLATGSPLRDNAVVVLALVLRGLRPEVEPPPS